jgi:hypothetical protein
VSVDLRVGVSASLYLPRHSNCMRCSPCSAGLCGGGVRAGGPEAEPDRGPA